MNIALATDAAPASKITYGGLRRFNFIMGCLHLGQGVLMLWLSTSFSLPVSTIYLKFDVSSGRLVQNLQDPYTLRIAPMVAIFLLLSAMAHFILASFGFNWYVANLKQHINKARWWEYSLSSSIMIVLIAMLVGVYDLSSLILIFCINACMIFFGYMMELHNQTTEKTSWTAFYFGCFAGIIPWVVIALYTIGSNQYPDTSVPDFVYGIMVSLFIFFNIFAVNQWLQYRQIGPWKDYLYGERVYIILSLVAKSALAWQMFFGTMRPV
ncbi:MAG: heliorhodopsin HeR [Actinobacteria bacterium]|nr:heliorhodopsin HeR [Actinomycetota bacterium]